MILNTHETEAWWLERVMDKTNMATSYKAYWLMGIIDIVTEREVEFIQFDEIILRMISNAWFTINMFKLSFGRQDQLHLLVNYLADTYPYLKGYSKSKLLFTLEHSEVINSDKIFIKMRNKMKQMVPYRLLSPFFKEQTRNIKDQKKNKLIQELTKSSSESIYVITDSMAIKIRPNWMGYLLKNQAVIKGWIQYKLVLYLQARNPNVPNIPLKIHPPNKRNLSKAQNFWKSVSDQVIVKDIYSGKILKEENYSKNGVLSIDHFIPWSFVLHDEFWNLTPTFKNINSKKNDALPDLNSYMSDYCNTHLLAITHLKEQKQNKILEDYYTISKGKLNFILSDDLEVSRNALFDSLEETILPLHQIAMNQGFTIWEKNDLIK